MMINKMDLYVFIRKRGSGIVCTVSRNGDPQAARVYIAVTPELDLIFYTLQTNRQCINLRHDPRIAVVIGWDSEQTLQYEGTAAEPCNEELDAAKAIYFDMLPDRSGRLGWPGLTFFRVTPNWIRFSNYDSPWRIDELRFPHGDVS